MKRKYFFVIYLYNENIKSILDLMRIIADPEQRNFAHITVKGPYRNIQKKRLTDDSAAIKGKEIKVLGTGNFFSDSQNTVFFKCEEREELYTIWKAKEDKTYKDFHPHITIYDGNNKMFAHELYEIISSHKINFSFVVDKLELYSSTDKNKLFNLRAQVDYHLLTQITGMVITSDSIDKLTFKQRIHIIDCLCNILEKVNYSANATGTNSSQIYNTSLLIDI